MAVVFVDACDGTCYTKYFDVRSECNISRIGETIRIDGNKEYFNLLARQMIYFASNDFCVPFGSHVHYDAFEHTGYHGLELILEVVRVQKQDIILDTNEGLYVEVVVPNHADELYTRWLDNAKVRVECDGQSVHILGNADGLMFIATVLLFLVENQNVESEFLCVAQLLKGWNGLSIRVVLA